MVGAPARSLSLAPSASARDRARDSPIPVPMASGSRRPNMVAGCKGPGPASVTVIARPPGAGAAATVTAPPSVPQRVINEDVQDVAHGGLRGRHDRQLPLAHLQGPARGLEPGDPVGPELIKHRRDVECGALAGAVASEAEQVRDGALQSRQRLQALDQDGAPVRAGGEQFGLECHDDGGEGGAQLVRGVGGEGPFPFDETADPLGTERQGPAEVVELGEPGGGDVHREVALPEPLGRGPQGDHGAEVGAAAATTRPGRRARPRRGRGWTSRRARPSSARCCPGPVRRPAPPRRPGLAPPRWRQRRPRCR